MTTFSEETSMHELEILLMRISGHLASEAGRLKINIGLSPGVYVLRGLSEAIFKSVIEIREERNEEKGPKGIES